MKKVEFEIEEKLLEKLDYFVKILRKTKDEIINEAIKNWIELQEWQLEQIEEGIRQANNGEFSTDNEILDLLLKDTNETDYLLQSKANAERLNESIKNVEAENIVQKELIDDDIKLIKKAIKEIENGEDEIITHKEFKARLKEMNSK